LTKKEKGIKIVNEVRFLAREKLKIRPGGGEG